MSMVKTAVSIEKELFDWVDNTAEADGVSRSRLFVVAIEKYRKSRESERMSDQYNKFFEKYGQNPDDEIVLQGIKRAAKNVLQKVPQDLIYGQHLVILTV
ncbi:MAG: hypothetical protein ABJA67_14890 [Chthonomonadales bacterium]